MADEQEVETTTPKDDPSWQGPPIAKTEANAAAVKANPYAHFDDETRKKYDGYLNTMDLAMAHTNMYSTPERQKAFEQVAGRISPEAATDLARYKMYRDGIPKPANDPNWQGPLAPNNDLPTTAPGPESEEQRIARADEDHKKFFQARENGDRAAFDLMEKQAAGRQNTANQYHYARLAAQPKPAATGETAPVATLQNKPGLDAAAMQAAKQLLIKQQQMRVRK